MGVVGVWDFMVMVDDEKVKAMAMVDGNGEAVMGW